MGTSGASYVLLELVEDHPHAYGDKNAVTRKGLQYIGSSPRVWGQVRKDGQEISYNKDHPHAYGDKFLILLPSILPLGSSPRVWGQEN